MSLKDVGTLPYLDTSTNDLIADFFVPMLANSIKYDRGVGFFSSGWFRIAAKGMAEFAINGGKARWVTSPILSEQDWEALEIGEKAKHDLGLKKMLSRNISDLSSTLESETLSAISWMVADSIIEFKIALPGNKLQQGDFHDKFGIFMDTLGDKISFNGSYNDSIQGTRNYESIKVFCSWNPAYEPLVIADAERFERLWNNEDPNVFVVDLPEASKNQIIQLRKHERPYPKPNWVKEPATQIQSSTLSPAIPKTPELITLRDYQKEAIEGWKKADFNGLFEMATGTGKTITALAGSATLFQEKGKLAVIISAPYQHLVDQWKEEAEGFGYRPVLAYRSKKRWLDELNHKIIDFNTNARKFISVITTHTTFISPDFQESIARLEGEILIIADEAHHLGAERGRQNYPGHIPYRLALSATPDRWFDDEGTEALRKYFGETVFEFSLEEAIGVSLTPYYYYPHLVPLTDDELEQYEELTHKIAKLVNREDLEGQEALKMLLIKRANLLNRAENKIKVLSHLVDSQDYIEHTLFYCAPGQIDDVMRLVGWDKGILAHRFTAEEDTTKRQELLLDFSSGELQALVAMKCLDEGVDVPNTRVAFVLASSSNPREFVQRRGRILRKSPGKEFSVIHDLIAVPPTSWAIDKTSASFEAERSIIKRELGRFKEFSNPALNKHEALDVIWAMAQKYNLMDF
jgi:DNA phosphorothioation system restriction enzyme